MQLNLKKKEPRNAQVGIRLTTAEKEMIEKYCLEHDFVVSDFCRQVVLGYMAELAKENE